MRVRVKSVAAAVCLVLLWNGTSSAEDVEPVTGLSAKDRVILATTMVQQGQCGNALVEINEALKALANDETLLRLKGTCEADMQRPAARETIMNWLKQAPQDHPERAKMLGLLAKVKAPGEHPQDWVLIPAGAFEMGTDGKPPSDPDESPKHTVALDDFYIGRYEVTNRQYHTFVSATGHRAPENCCDAKYNIWRDKTPLPGTEELPIINVSWDDAAAFCKWIGGRLPTEAEWEKAARGTDGRKYPWGNDPVTGNRANYSIENVTFWEGPATLAKKDQYEFGKSPYGLYEMAGNVWEWVQDYYDADFYKTSPDKNPTGPSSGTARVIRGGSWQNTPEILRSSNRNKQPPDQRAIFIGIRCAKDATGSK